MSLYDIDIDDIDIEDIDIDHIDIDHIDIDHIDAVAWDPTPNSELAFGSHNNAVGARTKLGWLDLYKFKPTLMSYRLKKIQHFILDHTSMRTTCWAG